MLQPGSPARDATRIVPLMGLAGALRAVPSAKLTYRGGPLIGNAEVTTVFWGGWWLEAPQADIVTRLNKFFDDILVSALMDQLAEYNVPGTAIGHGKRVATATADTAPPTSVDDTGITSFLQGLIAAQSVPAANANSIYFVYLPSGVSVTMGGQASCSAFCGYHDVIGGKIAYAVEPYPDCTGCMGGLAAFDALTLTSSHELCEAVTDPVPGHGWYDDANGEIGDICAWQSKKIAAYTVQLEWSNKAGACL
jgi:hypothetical protein